MKFKTYIIIILILFFNIAPVSAASYGGDLKIKVELRPFNLNPIYAENETEIMINKQIFDSLVNYNSQNEITSNLAESWEVNSDSNLFIFYLKEAVYFHPYKIEGKEVPLEERAVTAEDWKWSFEYLAASNNRLSNTNLFNKIKGFAEYSRGENTEITGIRVKDKYQLEIKLKESYYPFIYNLAKKEAVVMPAEAVSNSNFNFSKTPVGTGGFKFDTFSKNKVTLLKNDNYWKNNYNQEKKPYLNKIEINFAADNNLKNNLTEFNLYQLNTEEFIDYQKEKDKYSDYRLKKLADNSVYFTGLNYNGNLSQKNNYNNLQEILSSILNKNNFIDNLNLDNFILPAENSNFQPFLHQLNTNLRAEKINDLNHNLEKIILVINDSKTNIKIANDLKRILKAENIDLEIKKYSWTEYINKLNSGNLSSHLFIMTANYNSQFEFINDNLYSNSNSNYFGYQNERLDNLIDYLKLVNNQQSTEQAYQIITNILSENSPFIFIFQGADSYLVSNKLNNQERFGNLFEKYNFEELYLE